MEEFDFFKICEKCKDEECCREPYYAFIAENEIKRISNKIKELNLEIGDKSEDFIDIEVVYYNNEPLHFKVIKKINEKCVFLKNRRFCLINEVKPFDCKIWPLTYDYFPKENKLVIYLGDCPLTKKIPKSWINSTIEEIKKELKKRTKEELISYSILERDDTLKIIKEIPDFL
ncbi:MAG: YkgJ family cysteine cluster protein [Promethearchaeota archaeon]